MGKRKRSRKLLRSELSFYRRGSFFRRRSLFQNASLLQNVSLFQNVSHFQNVSRFQNVSFFQNAAILLCVFLLSGSLLLCGCGNGSVGTEKDMSLESTSVSENAQTGRSERLEQADTERPEQTEQSEQANAEQQEQTGCSEQTEQSEQADQSGQSVQTGQKAGMEMKEAGKLPADEEIIRYVVLMYTNKRFEEIEAYLPEMKYLHGEQSPESGRMYAFGVPGPMLLTQSPEEMREQMENCFQAAEKYDIPVFFQLDDVNNYTTYFGHGAELKFYEHPEMCEWISFPGDGETYGGEKEHGELPRFWFNWGSWMCAEAFPNLASPELQDFVTEQLEEGVIKPLTETLARLTEEGKEYLFAGMSIGWETHIPDYSKDNPLLSLEPENPPKDARTGRVMQEWEMAAYGYGALHSLGYDEEKLKEEAAEKGISADELRKNLLYQVIHDYSELIAKTAYDAGIPREKIFTHMVSNSSFSGVENPFTPPIWCAVNDYSIPGYTMSPVTCRYDLKVMKEKIASADPEMPYFANAEGYAAGVNEEEDASAYFNGLFGNGALVVTAFGYADPPSRFFTFKRTADFGYNIALRKWLDDVE